jgi:hypothetical protein
MAKFKIGEIIEGQNFIYQTYRNGMEGKIISDLELNTGRQAWDGIITTKYRHEISWSDGTTTLQQPWYLRKKKPPKEIDWVKMCKLNQIGEIA